MRFPGFDTLALHAGQPPDPATGARAVPIYASTSFVFEDSDHAAALFNMERAGHVYSRISNPTVAVFEERMAALEQGVGAIATASGQAALHLGDRHADGRRRPRGGEPVPVWWIAQSARLHVAALRHRDDLRHPARPGAWRAAVRPGTRLLFGETLGNPGLDVLDIPAVSAMAHEHGVPLLVDSTFTTPWLMTPFDHGADLVYHSATKFLGGHGVAIGGVLIDGGTFDWLASGRFPTLTEPYAGFHGMNFAEESTVAPFLLRARREGLRDFGACMSAHTAFLLLQGLETLPLRMQRHVENTREVVRFLAGHPAVESVAYPELESHPDHALAQRLLPRGAGAVFSFNLKGSRAAGRAFVEALRVFSHLANVGDAEVTGHTSGIDHAFPRAGR